MKRDAAYHRAYYRDRKAGIKRREIRERTLGDVSRIPYGVPVEFKQFARARFV